MTILVFFIVTWFCVINVSPRSIHSDESSLALQNQTQRVTTATPTSIDKVVWKKLDSLPRQDFQQHSENKSGTPQNEILSQSLKEQNIPKEKEQNTKLTNEFQTTEDWSQKLPLEMELQLLTANENGTSENSIHFDGFKTEEILAKFVNSSDSNNTSELLDFHTSNISDSVSNILDRTRDLFGLQSLSETSNVTDLLEFKETGLMDDESEIAAFQDVSTTGFEFLIDSETTQNLLLAELLSSESLFLNEDDEDSTDDNSMLETEPFLFQETENNSDISTSDIAGFQGLENKTTLSEINLGNVTEVIESDAKAPECPPPGWCVFWFMAQDTCAKDGHCLGSRICCKSGCSKTCLEVLS